ncbi:4'-phosphopantetheinyl transferase family protein [Mucilaginibacter glaciei]|uniref:4'-phosphopantetheinyl transferase superfamily protein n=1 Tax=Mucilaginibacter glaciei TaxID=2772109 RepID=A0A926NYS2_9SPHI|nr:4'-phosphopantetheinyl transferase superfamily protein [Mucilaginibacter glaciei]MBD1394378.1 4'-phosphopantetheinyl transferase superfamily protein [Mucilaginibacter glaciei]
MTGKVYNTFLGDVLWQVAHPVTPPLTENEVHVWQIRIGENLELLHNFSALLNQSEKQRGSKYLQQCDRDRFVISRGAQRVILAKYLNTDAARMEFALGENKKPYIATPAGSQLQFNVSHSGDWILIAVSQLHVGSDLEYVDAEFHFDDILPEHFSSEEISYINERDKTKRFYQLWTRKEALLKATGQGLGEHLQMTPALDGVHGIHPSLVGNNADWVTQTFNLADNYIGSITVEGNAARLQFWRIDFSGIIFY